jgi:hypothetical protein
MTLREVEPEYALEQQAEEVLAREPKRSYPSFGINRDVFERRDDSLSVRRQSRTLDTFRDIPPTAEDFHRLGDRFGERYIMTLYCLDGVMQRGKTLWREIPPDVRIIEADEQPHVSAPQVTQSPLDVEAMLERALSKQREEFERSASRVRGRRENRVRARRRFRATLMRDADMSQQSMPSIVEFMREQREQDRATRAEMREEFHAMMPKQSSAPESDAANQFLDNLDRFTQVAERIMPIREAQDERKGWLSQVADVVREVAEAAPTVVPLVGGLVARGMATPPPPMSSPMGEVQRVPSPQENVAAPMQQTEDSEAAMTIDVLITNIINDVQHDEAPDACVDDVVRLATEDTKWQPALAQILELPNVELLKTLKDAKGVDLSPLNNAGKFLDGLRKGVKARIKLQAPPTAQAVANNGNGSHAESVSA